MADCARCSAPLTALDTLPICVACRFRPGRLLRRSYLGALMITFLGWTHGQRKEAR